MTLIKGIGSIEDKVKREARERAAIRKQEDIHKGLTKADGAQRGDFKSCREADKVLSDYRKFKDPKDRVKITNEYFEAQGRRMS